MHQDEQAKISDIARKLEAGFQLSADELGILAERVVKARTKAESDSITEEIIRGFYGKKAVGTGRR